MIQFPPKYQQLALSCFYINELTCCFFISHLCTNAPYRQAKPISRPRKYQTIRVLLALVAVPPWKKCLLSSFCIFYLHKSQDRLVFEDIFYKSEELDFLSLTKISLEHLIQYKNPWWILIIKVGGWHRYMMSVCPVHELLEVGNRCLKPVLYSTLYYILFEIQQLESTAAL